MPGPRVRHVLDMRTGVAFSEAYTSDDSEVRVMERSMGWAPRRPDDPVRRIRLPDDARRPRVHTAAAFVYRSCDTDMLGWMCERAAGRRMADLVPS